ncbi:hypothetical protein HOG21_06675 [bacterium]|nr:hypothetical protein [bacterium]
MSASQSFCILADNFSKKSDNSELTKFEILFTNSFLSMSNHLTSAVCFISGKS